MEGSGRARVTTVTCRFFGVSFGTRGDFWVRFIFTLLERSVFSGVLSRVGRRLFHFVSSPS